MGDVLKNPNLTIEISRYKLKDNIPKVFKMLGFETTRENFMKPEFFFYKQSDHTYLSAGDAGGGANYQFGHGLNHGFQHSEWVGKVINDEMTPEQYDKSCKKLASEIENAARVIKFAGNIAEKLLVKEGEKRAAKIYEKRITNDPLAKNYQGLPDHTKELRSLIIKLTAFKYNKNTVFKPYMKYEIGDKVNCSDFVDLINQAKNSLLRQCTAALNEGDIRQIDETIKISKKSNELIDDMLKMIHAVNKKEDVKWLSTLMVDLTKNLKNEETSPNKLADTILKSLSETAENLQMEYKKENKRSIFQPLPRSNKVLISLHTLLNKHSEYAGSKKHTMLP